MFVPLHVKSDYSLGYGTATSEELAEEAARLAYPAIALTDIESLAGQVRFHHRCRALGVKPITGVELRPAFDRRGNIGSREGRLVLIARDRSGYQNLCRIVSRRSGASGRESSCSAKRDLLSLIAGNDEGLFAASDNLQVLTDLLNASIFPKDQLGFLLIRPKAGDEPSSHTETVQIESAKRFGIKLIADLDFVFLKRADYPLHLLQVAVRSNKKVETLHADQVENEERRFRSPAQAQALFADIPEALAGAEALESACNLDLISPLLSFSDVRSPDQEDASQLRKACGRILAERIRSGQWHDHYTNRLNAELALFERLGFSHFMLVIAAIIEYCREQGIPVSARGSAVSSLTLHLMGASPVDPIAEGLFFERFLHAEKSAWPDVDLDLPSNRRDEVIGWVYKRFGRDRVAMASAHHRFQRRSAIREGLKALGTAEKDIRRVLDALPPDDLFPGDEVNGSVIDHTDSTNLEIPQDVMLKLALARQLIGRVRQIALHPGGILIEREALDNLIPLECAAKGVVITQYDYADLAVLGMAKIDLLGNRCLSEIEETLRLAGFERPGRLENIRSGDRDTLALIDRAETVGCFQLESPAMRSLLSRIPIRSQSDIVAALALIRPGAASGQAKALFVRRARGEEPDEAIEPLIADRLAGTHGLLLFEEDIMALLSRVGGLTLAEADNLRAAIVESGGDPDRLALLKSDFLSRAQAALAARPDKIPAARFEQAWGAAARFAAYSFNKAHAASYGRLAYVSAYLKTHYRVEFTCALINHHQGFYPLRTVAAEMMRRGVTIRLPHVNISGYDTQLDADISVTDGRCVRIGLGKIKVLSTRTVRRILEERSDRGIFSSLSDLIGRISMPARELAALILAGACDGLTPLDPGSYPFIHDAVLQRLKEGTALADMEALRVAPAGSEDEHRSRKLYTGLVRVRNELRYLEMHITAHPIALLRAGADRYGCIPVREAIFRMPGEKIRVIALIAAMRRVPTSRGILQFLTIEDETGLLEGHVIQSVYRRIGEQVKTPGPYLIEGQMMRDQEASFAQISSMNAFHWRHHRPFNAGAAPQ